MEVAPQFSGLLAKQKLAGSILARETNSHCGCMTKNIKHDQTIKATRCGDPCDKGAGVKQNGDVELYQLKSH